MTIKFDCSQLGMVEQYVKVGALDMAAQHRADINHRIGVEIRKAWDVGCDLYVMHVAGGDYLKPATVVHFAHVKAGGPLPSCPEGVHAPYEWTIYRFDGRR